MINPLTPEKKAEIDAMSHEDMAYKWRFAPLGDVNMAGEVGQYFTERFQSLGGMTPQLSKQIGW